MNTSNVSPKADLYNPELPLLALEELRETIFEHPAVESYVSKAAESWLRHYMTVTYGPDKVIDMDDPIMQELLCQYQVVAMNKIMKALIAG